MAPLTAPRSTVRLGDSAVIDLIKAPIKTATAVWQGGIACVDATGFFVPGATATTLRAVGIFEKSAPANAGASGTQSVNVRRGTFKFANSSAGDLIAQADVFTDCYIVDDQTVAKTNGGSTRSVAGRVIQVDSDGVWVEIGNP